MSNFATNYINQNAPFFAENCIIFLYWENRSFTNSIEKEREHLRQYPVIEVSTTDFINAGLDILKSASTAEGVLNLARNNRIGWTSPFYKNARDYIKRHWEIDDTPEEIAAKVSRELAALNQ